jgi:TatD DNase family protein
MCEAAFGVLRLFRMFIDSHSHIEMDDFNEDREEVIQRALDAGIDLIVDIGDGDVSHDSHAAAFKVAEQYRFIYTTVGLHPHEARLLDANLYSRLAEMAQHPKVIAIGEIGLDYHYDHSPREVQREAFRKQLQLARKRELPIVIHTREAEADTIAIIREEWAGSARPGVIHCFTGTRALADAAVSLGFYISFSGVLTFKKAGDLRQTAAALPIDRILIETDCPFLAPEPYRGRRNEPAYVVETARRLAELSGLTAEEIGRITSQNFMRAFGMEGKLM